MLTAWAMVSKNRCNNILTMSDLYLDCFSIIYIVFDNTCVVHEALQ